MGNKIITEEDFWICSEGAMPSPFQGTRKSLHDSSGHLYITKSDTSTISWIDFGCKKYMLLMAIIAAIAVVVAVAVGVLTVATGGAGLILLGAVAGLVGGAIGAVIGGLLCGHKMGPAREWDSKKPDMILQGMPVITGGCTMTCKAGGTVQYAPNIKSWMGAIAYAGLSYGSELVKCAFAGAAVGTVGSLLGVGSVAVAGSGGTVGTGISLTRASMVLARPTVASVMSNIGASFGIGGGWTGAGVALGSRGIFGAESAATTYAKDAVGENGESISVVDSFAKGALPEYEFGSRIANEGISGLQWSDALLGLYLLNLKVDPPGTFRDANGTLKNSRGNPNGLKTGTIASDPRKVKSGGTGKAYEDHRPSHTNDAINDTWNNNKNKRTGKVKDPVSKEEINWKPGEPREGVWSMGHKPGYEYRHLRKAYMEGRITKDQFLEYFNDPKYYRPETPATSSKHAHESDISLYDFDN
ncbi:HNH/ENDO VII family nuclease [Pedobacter sp. AJM]|uniref:HNH/ENDO VII family nuclease n=1 Tax=Pedobacter TaxID=84567 RepID=UPI000B4BD50F|nr:HNH/ENDO VII family nuclease [Pedobacter sp. AJM]OWK70940.1 hypothetical protein CBW18_07580 [Pedobacter sp. AJM]